MRIRLTLSSTAARISDKSLQELSSLAGQWIATLSSVTSTRHVSVAPRTPVGSRLNAVLLAPLPSGSSSGMVDTSFPKESDLREIRNVQQREAAQKLQEWVLLDIGVAIDGFEFCVQQQDRDLLSASVTEIKMDVLQRPLDREIKASFASFNIADASLVIPMQVVTVGSMQATIISAEPDSPFVASPVASTCSPCIKFCATIIMPRGTTICNGFVMK